MKVKQTKLTRQIKWKKALSEILPFIDWHYDEIFWEYVNMPCPSLYLGMPLFFGTVDDN